VQIRCHHHILSKQLCNAFVPHPCFQECWEIHMCFRGSWDLFFLRSWDHHWIQFNSIQFTGERLTRMSAHRSSVPNLNDPSPLLPRSLRPSLASHTWEKLARSRSPSRLPERHSEPAPTCALWRMNDKWSGNSFLLGFSSLANHGGYLSCFPFFSFFFLPTYLPTYQELTSRFLVGR
jgi:hypothetical protein